MINKRGLTLAELTAMVEERDRELVLLRQLVADLEEVQEAYRRRAPLAVMLLTVKHVPESLARYQKFREQQARAG